MCLPRHDILEFAVCEEGCGELRKRGQESADEVGMPAKTVDLVGKSWKGRDGGGGGGLVLRR